jgi:dephospho-CoA kinase
MHLFGLTGGIASGKSTVAARFRARGVSVIDADELARLAVVPGTPGYDQIVMHFGGEILSKDGTIDRKRLGALVFADESNRAALNKIVHPQIAALGIVHRQALADRGEVLACYEAALLIENNLQDAFRPLVVVALPTALQIERICQRNGIHQLEAEARVAAQYPLERKMAVADYVIDNSQPWELVTVRVDAVLDAVRRDCGVDPP